MKTAMITKDGGKFKVTDPRPGHGVEIFEAKDVDKALERVNAINAEIAAESAPAGPRIELLSKDGKPVNGVPTRKATDAVVFTSKKNGATKDTTELDLVNVAGYVLVGRDHSGNVRAEWGNPPDFGRYVPLSVAGLTALQGLITPAE